MKIVKNFLAVFLLIAISIATVFLSACDFRKSETPPSGGAPEEELPSENPEKPTEPEKPEKPDKPDDLPPENTVEYGDYGAKGDGVTDDFKAIKAAHDYANQNGLAVCAQNGARYYIGAHRDTVTIKTDTYWTGAEFVIDDTEVSINDRTFDIFEVAPESKESSVKIPKNYSITAGQKQLTGLSLKSDCLLQIENSNKKDYIRYGGNQNNGTTRQEVILVDKNGTVNAATPVLWDYEQVTKITAYSVNDKAITVKGGSFTTKANKAEISANYYKRGIKVKRSNTTLSGITHRVEGEGAQGSPYTGFYAIEGANNVTVENCVLTGHKTYTNVKPTGTVSQGTYDTQAVRSNNVVWRNCTQSNSITDTAYWGVMASNFCKNLVMEGCNLSRFDAHQGVYNATIKDTVLGQNLTIIGAGTLKIENVSRTSGTYFMQLRTDYGSTWEGDIIFKDCTFTPLDKNGNPAVGYAVYAKWNDWDFGYPCYMPKTITFNNFKVNGNKPCYVFHTVADKTAAEIKASKNPYAITEKIVFKNGCSNLNLSSNSSGIFDKVVVERK